MLSEKLCTTESVAPAIVLAPDRVASESNDVIRMLDQIVKDKQVKAVKKYTKTDVDAIYSMLEENDPLKGEENGDQ